jgi:hypothetical protein
MQRSISGSAYWKNEAMGITISRPFFYPAAWCDILEIIHSKEETTFTQTGIRVGPGTSNLCMKAYHPGCGAGTKQVLYIYTCTR